MAVIEVVPIVMKDATLSIPSTTGSDFKKHVSKVQFDPTTPTTSWTGLGGNVHTAIGTTTWAVAIDYAQDWGTVGSLSQYLLENAGDKVNITFAPEAGGPSFTADVLIVPGAIGGAVNAVATASVTLPVVGAPVPVPAA